MELAKIVIGAIPLILNTIKEVKGNKSQWMLLGERLKVLLGPVKQLQVCSA
jgi:hypothetical protein